MADGPISALHRPRCYDQVTPQGLAKASQPPTLGSQLGAPPNPVSGLANFFEAKDIEDIVNVILVAEAPAVWNGSDTSLSPR